MQLAHPIIATLDYVGYSATDDNYEEGCPGGHGDTPLAAVQDLLEQVEAEPFPVTFIEQRGQQYVVHHHTADSAFPQDVFASVNEAKTRVMELLN